MEVKWWMEADRVTLGSYRWSQGTRRTMPRVPRQVKKTLSVSTPVNGPGEGGAFVGEPYCPRMSRASVE